MEENDPLTESVIGAAIEVHRLMGPGLMESIYQKCMEEELRLRGCACQPLARVPLQYKGVTLGDDLVMDLYFPGKLVVELKAVEKLLPRPRSAVDLVPQVEQDACRFAHQL